MEAVSMIFTNTTPQRKLRKDTAKTVIKIEMVIKAKEMAIDKAKMLASF